MIGRSLKTTFHKAILENKGSWGSTLPITNSKKTAEKSPGVGRVEALWPRDSAGDKKSSSFVLFFLLCLLLSISSLSSLKLEQRRRAPIPGIPLAPCHPPPISHKVGGRWAQCCRMEGEGTSRVEAVKSLTPWPGYWGPVEYIWIMEGAKY